MAPRSTDGRFTILLTIASLAISVSGISNPISADDLEQDLDKFIPEVLGCRKLAGVNIAVVRDSDTLLTKGYGHVDMTSKENVTDQTLFGIASLSKAYTSILLGKVLALSDKGFTWDTEVRVILGEDFYFNDALRTLNASLRDLLTHRMGYPSYNSIRHQSGLDRSTLVKKFQFLKPNLPFRSTFKYNNLMYGLLTYITEVIGGDTWENLMKKHIFQPLGMTSSGFTHQIDLTRKDLAKSYQVDYDGDFREVSPQYHSYWGKIGGSGSIVSNAVDMSKWVHVLLNQGKSEDGSDVIPSDVIEDTLTPYITLADTSSDKPYMRPVAPVSYTHFSYGLAWRIGFYRGWRMIHHTGTSMGYLAQLTLVPDLKVGVVTSLTGDDPGYTCRRHIHLHTLDLMMGEIPWINTTSTCGENQGGKFRSESTRNQAKMEMGKDLTVYEGTYGDFAFGNVTFYVNETGKLSMSYGDWGIWELHPNTEADSFDASGTGHVWNWNFRNVVFSYSQGGSTGPMDQVTIHSMERSYPPTFVRGRKMSEMPPPPDLSCTLPKTGEVSAATNMTLSIWLVICFLISVCVKGSGMIE